VSEVKISKKSFGQTAGINNYLVISYLIPWSDRNVQLQKRKTLFVLSPQTSLAGFGGSLPPYPIPSRRAWTSQGTCDSWNLPMLLAYWLLWQSARTTVQNFSDRFACRL